MKHSEEIKKLEIETKRLRLLAIDERIPYEKSQKMRKEQDNLWKKLQFLKGLSERGVTWHQ